MKAVFTFLLVLCCLAVSRATWYCTKGPMLSNAQQIDAGQGQVVALDDSSYPYFLIGSSWHRMTTTKFRHISVGPAGLWALGITWRTEVYKWIHGFFKWAEGSRLTQLDAGGLGQLVGAYYNSPLCLRDTYASAFRGVGAARGWMLIRTGLVYQSCSPRSGCWGVDKQSRATYVQTINSSSCAVTGVRTIPGQSFRMIEVSTDGSVFGVSRSQRIYQRTGINSTVPYGTDWTEVGLCMTARHVSYDLGTLWVVTTNGTIVTCRE